MDVSPVASPPASTGSSEGAASFVRVASPAAGSSSQPIDPARLCLKSVRLELVERGMDFDELSPNGLKTSPCRINFVSKIIKSPLSPLLA